jgi:hypothetical protein
MLVAVPLEMVALVLPAHCLALQFFMLVVEVVEHIAEPVEPVEMAVAVMALEIALLHLLEPQTEVEAQALPVTPEL